MDWLELETSNYQDHVIKHVIGATVLGWLIAGEAVHLLLDIGLLWTIYLDGEMNLLPQGVALPELEGDELSSADRAQLTSDADLLLGKGRDAQGLQRITAAPVECLITSVDFFGCGSRRRVAIRGENHDLEIVVSVETGEITVGV